MSFINQFKVLLWKNWKIFRQKSLIFILLEVFFTTAIICSLAVRVKEKDDYDVLPSTEPTLVQPVYALSDSDVLGVVLPKHPSIDGDEFIRYLKSDKDISMANYYKKEFHRSFTIQKFDTEKDLEDYSMKDTKRNLVAGIVFGDDYTDYTIRIRGSDVVDPKEKPIGNYGKSRKSEIFDTGAFNPKRRYQYIGFTQGDAYNYTFVPLQMAIDRTIMRYKSDGLIVGLDVYAGKLSKPEIKYRLSEEENRETSYEGYSPVIAFIYIGQVFHLISRIMKEKENGTRDGLISIGANRVYLWLSWFFIYMPFSLLSLVFPVLVDPPELMDTINRFLFFIMAIIYAFTVYELVTILCLLSKKTKTVTMLACIVFCSLFKVNDLVYQLKIDEKNEKIEKILSAIFSPIGVSMGCSVITYEDNRNGYIGFGNMFETEFGQYFVFLLVDAIVYFIIAVAIDYASGINIRTIGIRKSQMNASDEVSFAPDIQDDPVGGELFVQVKNIYKYFRFRRNIGVDNDENDKKLGKVFAANRNISFNVYKNEIFAILGHNGAGKSTLIQNMIGMQRADDGETFYNGLAISKNKKKDSS